MSPLTPRQAEVLIFIRQHLAEHHYPPTAREIARAFGFGHPEGGNCHVRALTKKGYIRCVPHTARGITLVGEPCRCCGGTGIAPAATQDNAPAVPIESQDSTFS